MTLPRGLIALLLAALVATIVADFARDRTVDPDVPDFVYDGAAALDRFARLARYPGKTAVACPAQDARSAVILAVGQSNIANYGERIVRSDFPDRVFNFFNGACFAAGSPLLGAGGSQGEWLTMLGDALVRDGRHSSVTIAPAAIGGANIHRFSDGDLAEMLDGTARKLVAANLVVTHVIWHQGESDFRDGTSSSGYRAAFMKILAGLRARGVAAPVYISVATRCLSMRADWTPENDISAALRSLPDDRQALVSGVDTDAFDPSARYDSCHLSAQGQADLAALYRRRLIDRPH